MEVTYTTPNGRITFELESTSPKQAFEQIAAIQELFEEPRCGMCKSEHIKMDVREHDGNRYYKLSCTACGAQIDFGSHKDGKTLFIKRFDKDKNRIANNGWYKYRKED